MKRDKEFNEEYHKESINYEEWKNDFLNETPIFEDFDSIVRISVTAKNSYGGYVSVNLECGLNNGKFSTESVSNYEQKKELRRIGEKGCHFEALSSSEMEFLGSIQRIGAAARA